MAQPARIPDAEPAPIASPAGGEQACPPSGQVHGPVAAMHDAIRDRLGVQVDQAGVGVLPDPVEVFLRHASRAAGWLVLCAAFSGVAALIA